MSLMKTLAKVAIGVAAAKGAKALMQNRSGGGTRTAGSGSVFGGGMSRNEYQSKGRGGIEDMLGSVLGGGAAGGGLGSVLAGLGASAGRGGGMDGLAGRMTGAGAGGLGGLIGALTGAAQGQQRADAPDFGSQLNDAFVRQAEPQVPPTPDQEAAAGLMLVAMVMAMKADGQIDQAEKARLLDKLNDATPEERAFVERAMGTDMSVRDLAAAIPQGLEPQVYAMSVMAIDLDSQAEAEYLDRLARAVGLSKQMVNQIHEQLGVPTLYA